MQRRTTESGSICGGEVRDDARPDARHSCILRCTAQSRQRQLQPGDATVIMRWWVPARVEPALPRARLVRGPRIEQMGGQLALHQIDDAAADAFKGAFHRLLEAWAGDVRGHCGGPARAEIRLA